MHVRPSKNIWQTEQNRNGFSDRQIKTNALRYMVASVRIARDLEELGHPGAVAYWVAALGFAEARFS